MNGSAKCTKWGGLGLLGGTQGRSRAMPPFDTAHSTLIETMCLSFAVFEI